MRLAKWVLEKILQRREFELKDIRTPLRRQKEFFDFVKSRGFVANTIIDVGVGPDGTPWFLDAWPDAYLVLIEPNTEIEDNLKSLLRHRSGEIHMVGAGASDRNAVLHLNETQPSSSSMYELSEEHNHANKLHNLVYERTVVDIVMRRIDVMRNKKWLGPYVMKLDCEGFEMEALKGAAESLKETGMIISEISIANRYKDGYSFRDIIEFLDDSHFQLFDIIDMQQYGRSGKLNTIDAVFVPKDSPLLF